MSSSSIQNDDRDGETVRLSKRMSELGICSKREAAKILKEASECYNVESLAFMKEVIYLHGNPVMGGTAVKVVPGETHIEIRSGDDPPSKEDEGAEFKLVSYADRPWDEIKGDTIVMHKPVGYVSGQEEHQHVPAVRLLTRGNMHLDGFDEETKRDLKNGPALHFDRWKYDGYDIKANSVPRRVRETLDDQKLNERSSDDVVKTLSGYAPAGRLDIDSTGVILFTRAGMMARQIIYPKSDVAKEYIVKVQPAVQPTVRELEVGLTKLPPPTDDLSMLLKKGNRLYNEPKPLKPLLAAEWLNVGEQTKDDWNQETFTMRLVLVEGKKRQIRRMCRELLGWHVVELLRTSVGPVKIDNLPVGKWRPLAQDEVKAIFAEQPTLPKQSKSAKRNRAADDELDIVSDMVKSELSSMANSLPHEKQVMLAIRKALNKEPSKKLTISRVRKKAGKLLAFKPEDVAMKNSWKQYVEEIIAANPEQLMTEGGEHVVLMQSKNRS